MRLPAALQLCFPGSCLAASHSHVNCGSFCLPQLHSGEDEDVLGQATTHLLGFHSHSHCISTPMVDLLPLSLWHCPLAVLDTHCWLWGVVAALRACAFASSGGWQPRQVYFCGFIFGLMLLALLLALAITS